MMRRLIAAALLVLLVIQATGSSALASSRISHSVPPVLAQINAGFFTMLSILENTQIFAVVTGYGDRWTATHAAPARPVAVVPVARPKLRITSTTRIAMPAWEQLWSGSDLFAP